MNNVCFIVNRIFFPLYARIVLKPSNLNNFFRHLMSNYTEDERRIVLIYHWITKLEWTRKRTSNLLQISFHCYASVWALRYESNQHYTLHALTSYYQALCPCVVTSEKWAPTDITDTMLVTYHVSHQEAPLGLNSGSDTWWFCCD